jgi:hypothetical protein
MHHALSVAPSAALVTSTPSYQDDVNIYTGTGMNFLTASGAR